MALSHSVVCHRQVIDHEWIDDIAAFRGRALDYADRALRFGGDDAKVVAQVAAGVSGLDSTPTRAIALANQAISLNPASSFVWLISGSIRLRDGEPELAAEHLETSLRLDPISTTSGLARMYLASARFQQGRFGEALELFNTTTLRLPLSYIVLASLHGHLGHAGEAREALAHFSALSAGVIDKFTRIWFAGEQSRTLLLEGIDRAGVGSASGESGGTQ